MSQPLIIHGNRVRQEVMRKKINLRQSKDDYSQQKVPDLEAKYLRKKEKKKKLRKKLKLVCKGYEKNHY